MKKLLSIVLVATLAMPLFAERMTPEERAARDFSSYLPVAGDFSIGFNLDPLSAYAGQFFNGHNTGNALGNLAGEALGNNMVSVMGGYMLTDQMQVKANIGFGFTRSTDYYYAIDDRAVDLNPLSRVKVTDRAKTRTNRGSIALGIDYRLGKTRPVQAVLGAGVLYAFGDAQGRYAYGNAITEMNQKPTINAAMPAYAAAAGYMPNARILSQSTGALNHEFGLYASVGVEWFVAPKIALGANVNLAFLYNITPATQTVYEGWNTMTKQVEEFTELQTPASNGWKFNTDNIGANLYVNFYFNK